MQELPWKNMKQLIEDKAALNGSKEFMFFEDQVVSYGEVHEKSNIVANNLRGLGIGKGDRVLVFLFNSVEYVIIWFALAKVGAVMVPINTASKQHDLIHIIQDSEAETIIVESDLWERYEAVRSAVHITREILMEGGPGDLPKGVVSYESLREGSPADLDTDLKVHDPHHHNLHQRHHGKTKRRGAAPVLLRALRLGHYEIRGP